MKRRDEPALRAPNQVWCAEIVTSPCGLPSVTWKGEANRLSGDHIHLAASAACACIWDAERLKSRRYGLPKAARSAEAQDFRAVQNAPRFRHLLGIAC
jgi:hypothetical protein